MLYNIYYSENYMSNDFPLYIQETKEFNNFKEATFYAFQRCLENSQSLIVLKILLITQNGILI